MHVTYLGSARSTTSSATGACQSSSTNKQYKILAVDDQPLNRKIYKLVLEGLNCQVDLAEDGQQACERADKSKYDLILMDCKMPIMDGPDASKKIHENGKLNRCTPIIAVTSTLSQGMMERCIESTIDNIVPKPISSSIVRKLLKEWAGKTSGHAIEFTNSNNSSA